MIRKSSALPAGDFREAVKKFRVSNDGLNPTADEETTPDQLQGISVRLEQDVVPYADFGVLRPFGQTPGADAEVPRSVLGSSQGCICGEGTAWSAKY